MGKRRKRKGDAVIVPVASMGDIAFLLIIFFMVCSNFVKEGRVQLEPPKAKDIDTIQETSVSVSIDQEGVIYLQGVEISAADDLEGGVAALIKDKVTQEGRTVVFKCDRNIPREIFEPVLDAVSRSGAIIAATGDKVEEE